MEVIEIRLLMLSPTRGTFNKKKKKRKDELFLELMKELENFNESWNINGLNVDLNIKFNDYRTSNNEYLKNERILRGALIIEAEADLKKTFGKQSQRI